MFNKPLQHTIWTLSQTQLHSYSKSIQLGEKVELIVKTPETVVMSDRLHVDYFWGQ